MNKLKEPTYISVCGSNETDLIFLNDIIKTVS
jgi:hypothetical protein